MENNKETLENYKIRENEKSGLGNRIFDGIGGLAIGSMSIGGLGIKTLEAAFKMCYYIQTNADFNFYNNLIPVGAILRGAFKRPVPVPYKTWIQEQNREVRPKKKFNIVSFEDNPLDNGRFTDLPENPVNIIIMRSLRECMHCGKEFENVRSDFCSDDCASEVSE